MHYCAMAVAWFTSLARMCTQNCLSINVTGRQYLRPHSTQSVMADDFKKGTVEIQPATCTRSFSDYEQIRSA